MYLLKTEIIENGFGPQYFPDDTECEIEARVNALQTRLQKEKAPIMLEKAELVAIILFTHEKSDLYVNLKTTMTGKGKKKDQRPKVKCLDFIGQSRSYAQWKEEYQKSEGKQYKWPVLQLILQFAVVKIAMSRLEPTNKFLNYGL